VLVEGNPASDPTTPSAIHNAGLTGLLTRCKLIMPLPLLFFGDIIFGIGSTKYLSMAMRGALRRVAILMTMVGESYFLKQTFPLQLKMALAVMIVAGGMAAASDLSFNPLGYTLVMLNNLFSAANGLVMKSKLNAKTFTRWGMLYYNTLVSLPLTIGLCMQSGDSLDVLLSINWTPTMVLVLINVLALALVLNVAIVYCTQVNSPTTTSVVGDLKNMVVAALSMAGIGGDYVYSPLNAASIVLGLMGASYYTYVKLSAEQGQDKTEVLPSKGKYAVVTCTEGPERG
jgi:solute carrier family 35 protein